ncbi:hypothetical protein KI387_039295 [Taxus chinensis]|uniref:BTB domain-containing protein n=1 Tax=Taxus chinensis TaxID=29808 RepID=A0AA38FBR2_TAXCH|nr:hypothetical protein KI387_039295 [Taxus chinensis]
MATKELQFRSADIKLRLEGQDGKEYKGNPLRLHLQILEKSEYFKAMVSKRWSCNKKRVEIEVTTVHDFEYYVKCIALMRSSLEIGQRFSFCNVDECLAVLSIASEWLADDCINQCMGYLEAARCTPEQKSQISNLLLSLQLNVLPDLDRCLQAKIYEHNAGIHLVVQTVAVPSALVNQWQEFYLHDNGVWNGLAPGEYLTSPDQRIRLEMEREVHKFTTPNVVITICVCWTEYYIVGTYEFVPGQWLPRDFKATIPYLRPYALQGYSWASVSNAYAFLDCYVMHNYKNSSHIDFLDVMVSDRGLIETRKRCSHSNFETPMEKTGFLDCLCGHFICSVMTMVFRMVLHQGSISHLRTRE